MTSEKLIECLTPEIFKEYLESLEPNMSIGMKRSALHCPIATFLLKRGYSTPSVSCMFVCGSDKRINTPKWVKRFIECIDLDHTIIEWVTRSKAVEALNKISS